MTDTEVCVKSTQDGTANCPDADQMRSSQDDDDSESWADANDLPQPDDERSAKIEDDLKTARESGANQSCSSGVASLSNKSLTQPAIKPLLSPEDLLLHEAVFSNDASKVYNILKDQDKCKQCINKKDKHGNTPLHLACMLGRSREMVSALLQSGAQVDCKNLQRWTPFHEACSYGNREIISLLTKRLKDDVYEALNMNKLSENLGKTRNYRLVLKWEFQSWVPFLSKVLPSDVCVITKQGKYIRIDTRLLDYEMLSWKKGHSCLIYSNKFEKKWIVMNNKTKKFQHFETPNIDTDLEDKVDEFMSTDIMDFELKSSEIQLTRSTCGWIWKADKMERVGKYSAALYNFNNVFLVTRKRREHLNEEDLKRNKEAYKSAVHTLKFGRKPDSKDLDELSGQDYGDEEDSTDARGILNSQESSEGSETAHRESLLPPPPTPVSWSQYCSAEPGNFPTLGREQKCKTTSRAFKASIAMSEEFPITKNEFLDLLSIIPLKMFKKLKEFIEMRLPEGFPMRLDVPIFPFLTARITFEDLTFLEGPIDESLFSIPNDYEEDPNLFPFLSGKSKRSTSGTFDDK